MTRATIRTGAISAALLMAVAAGRGAPSLAASDAGLARVFEAWRDNVVAITYTLRPREKPTGGEGRKVEDAICGVLIDAQGLIVTSGDPFPDP
ncbi:MAG TPA: hypothetical protein VFP98_00205, partial [Candidatus Polarisedimenticolia bacterium]|nr:hypothetical protein [Candidatus Polarisedimenticolia bacterium]